MRLPFQDSDLTCWVLIVAVWVDLAGSHQDLGAGRSVSYLSAILFFNRASLVFTDSFV